MSKPLCLEAEAGKPPDVSVDVCFIIPLADQPRQSHTSRPKPMQKRILVRKFGSLAVASGDY
jgi:hypothetical protein